MSVRRYRIRACAKINLGLKIVGCRPDGYHELRTVFQTLTLADQLHLELSPGRGVVVDASGFPSPAGSGNLAFRAAELAAEAFGLRTHIAIKLEKRIPAGAGLGGGSSDAAAVLRVLARAAAQPPAPALLLRLGRQLGADVPAFLIGGTVLGLGRGDEVYALPDLGRWHCALAMPRRGLGVGIATPEAFAQWDLAHPRGLTSPDDSDTIIEFCSLMQQVLPAFRLGRNRGAPRALPSRAGGPKVHAGIGNDFQAGVFSLSADFPRIHQQLCRSSAAWVSLTGSGAAQFGLFAGAEAAAQTAARLAREYRSWCSRFASRAEVQRGWRAG